MTVIYDYLQAVQTANIKDGAVTDAKIAASGITTRTKLPSAIAYEDEANTFTADQTVGAGGTGAVTRVIVVNSGNSGASTSGVILKRNSVQELSITADGTNCFVGSAVASRPLGIYTNAGVIKFSVDGTVSYQLTLDANGKAVRIPASGSAQNWQDALGLEFYAGADYRIGFSNENGTKGWLRYNVDTADGVHAHVFSAGPLATATKLFQIAGNGHTGINAGAKFHFDGWDLTGNTYRVEISADVLQDVVGGTVAVKHDQPNGVSIMGLANLIFGCPGAYIGDGSLSNNQVNFYVNEAGNLLTIKVKYSTGTVKTATVALA